VVERAGGERAHRDLGETQRPAVVLEFVGRRLVRFDPGRTAKIADPQIVTRRPEAVEQRRPEDHGRDRRVDDEVAVSP
jgi:hypothetical protein